MLRILQKVTLHSAANLPGLGAYQLHLCACFHQNLTRHVDLTADPNGYSDPYVRVTLLSAEGEPLTQ